MEDGNSSETREKNQTLIEKIYNKTDKSKNIEDKPVEIKKEKPLDYKDKYDYAETIIEEEPLSLLEKEIEMIKRALERSNGKRKKAADELGISERTLYRKIKQYDLNELDE